MFAGILSGLIAMRKFLEKNGWGGHSSFCIVVFQQIQFICDLQDAPNQKNSSFDFSLKAILLQFWKKSHFLKN